VDYLALSIRTNFWLRWLVHEAWHGIRAQSLEFESSLSQFIQKLLLPPSESTYMPLELYLWVSTCWLVSRHTWGGVLSVYVDFLALSINSDFWLRWLLHETWQYAFALLSRQCLQAVCDMNKRNHSKVLFHQLTWKSWHGPRLNINGSGCCRCMYKSIVLALSTSLVFWLRRLVHEAWQIFHVWWIFSYFLLNAGSAWF
jgi:hypothetical protein